MVTVAAAVRSFVRSHRAWQRNLELGANTDTEPALRLRYPSKISTVVVLPAPLGPSNANISPSWTWRSIPSTALRVPYCLCSPRTSIAGELVMGITMTGWDVVVTYRSTASRVNRSVDSSAGPSGVPTTTRAGANRILAWEDLQIANLAEQEPPSNPFLLREGAGAV